jgi:hypothetical protein
MRCQGQVKKESELRQYHLMTSTNCKLHTQDNKHEMSENRVLVATTALPHKNRQEMQTQHNNHELTGSGEHPTEVRSAKHSPVPSVGADSYEYGAMSPEHFSFRASP